jgi:hypothetical protein
LSSAEKVAGAVIKPIAQSNTVMEANRRISFLLHELKLDQIESNSHAEQRPLLV